MSLAVYRVYQVPHVALVPMPMLMSLLVPVPVLVQVPMRLLLLLQMQVPADLTDDVPNQDLAVDD